MSELPAWRETPLLLECAGEHLLAMLCTPYRVAGDIGVVIVVGGPQYRAGSHRQFVQLARALASSGTPALRFDVRGMGDSTGDKRPFTALSADIGAAVRGLLETCTDLRRVVLFGLCDGASAALLYLHEQPDPKVAGLVLLNPWVRTEAAASSATLVQHYYLQRLFDRGLWKKLLSGGVGQRAVRDFMGHLARAARRKRAPAKAGADAPYPARMAAALTAHAGPSLLVLSGEDLTAREFLEHAKGDPTWTACLQRPQVQRLDLPQADHTLSAADDRQRVEAGCIALLRHLGGVADAAATRPWVRSTDSTSTT